jgi:methylmalonyl-CoA/ethylmalonyl-CoA epimerase
MKLGIGWVGNTQLEVIQPEEGPSLYHEYLKAHGEGVHHLLVDTGDVSFPQAIARFSAFGYSIGQGAKLNLPLQLGPLTFPPVPRWLENFLCSEIAYLETDKELTTILELSRLPPMLFRVGLKIGKPDYWIPADETDFRKELSASFINRISKVGIVTRDLNKIIRNYEDHMGVGPWKVYTEESPQTCKIKMRGVEVNFRARFAVNQIDDKLLEIVQPLEGRSLYHEFLAARGEGVQYIGIGTKGLSFSQALNRFASLGCEVIMEGEMKNSHPFAFLDTAPLISTTLEVILPRD